MNADDVHAAEQRWHLLSLREQDEWGHHADPRRAFIAATLAPPSAAERIETAAQVLHGRRHRAGTAHTCGRCREDAAAVAAVLTASPDTGETP